MGLRSENVSRSGDVRLEIRLLGAPAVWLRGEPVRFRSRKVLALLVFLVVEGGFHRRERLVELLWPESQAGKGATTLRSTLSRLREALGEAAEILHADRVGVGVTLAGSDTVDVHDLVAMAEAVDTPLRGIRVVGGRFLDGLGVDASSDFDDWVERWTAICQGHQTALFERLSTRALEHGRLAEAEGLASEWQTIAPFDDGPIRRLIEVDARRGARASALERYERYRATLAAEFDVRPGAELESLIERVRDGDLAQPSPLDALRDHLDRGRTALDRQDPRDAVVALDQASLLLDTLGPGDAAGFTVAVLETRARALEQCQRFDAARDDYQRLIDRADDHHDLTWRLAGLVGLAALHATPTPLASNDLATRYSEAAIDLARLLGDPESEARARWALLLVAHYRLGDEDSALEHGLRGVEAARAAGDSATLPRLWNDLHWVHAARGDLDAASVTLGEAIAAWERAGDRSMLADSLNGAVLLATLRGDFEEALAVAARGDELARGARNLWNQLAINANLGLLRREVGRYDRGISALRAACDVATDGMPVARAFYQLTLAVLLGDLGLADMVEALCVDVEGLAADLPGFWLAPETITTLRIRNRVQAGSVDPADLDRVEAIADQPVGLSLASVLAPAVACAAARDLDQPSRALSIAERNIAAAEQASAALNRPEILLSMAAAHLDLRATDAAAISLTGAVTAADEIGSKRLRWRQRITAARLHRAAGDDEQAEMELRAHRDECAELLAGIPGPYRPSFEALVSAARDEV